MSAPSFGGSQAEKPILLFLDEDSDFASKITFRSLFIPLALTLCYILLLIWTIIKDRKDKEESNKIDLKLSAAISNAQTQTNITRPYNKWDMNRTQENWTNVTAMNVTSANTVTDRGEEEGNSVSFVMNKTNTSNISQSQVRNYRRNPSFDENIKRSEIELSNKFQNNLQNRSSTSVLAGGNVNLDDVPHHKLVDTGPQEYEQVEGGRRVDTQIIRKRRRTNSTNVKDHKKETFKSKFLKLSMERNPVLSTYFKPSRIFPRSKRLTLIFLLLELNLFMTSLIFLLRKSQLKLRADTYVMYLILDWVIFIMLVVLTRVSKERLKSAAGMQEFLASLEVVKKEGIVKMIMLGIIFFVVTLVSLAQLTAFFVIYPHLYMQLIVGGAVMSVIHLGIVDLAWCAFLAFVYVRGYNSESFRAIYRGANCAAWKI